MKRRLRIVSVCRSFPTTADPSLGVFVLNRVEALARRADVSAVQPIPYFPGIAPLPDWARAPSRRQRELEIAHAPMFYFPGILKRLDAGWLARSIHGHCAAARARAPLDLIDAHFGYPEGAGCIRVGRRLGVPVFITIRGFEQEYAHDTSVGPRMIEALRSAQGCVAVSHSLAELALAQGVSPDRLLVVHNAIDSSVFHYSERHAARERLGFDPGATLIVSVGQQISRKRHHVLIEAFAGIAAKQPGARLVIVGGPSFEPDYPGRLRELVDRLGIAAKVDFAGNLDPGRVVEWLAAADVFALATAREGCCNAVLEALATGVPVVTTRVGDNAHFVREGENGFLVPVDDAPAMRAAIEAALDGRAGMARDAIAASLQRQVGSWDDVAAKVVGFFEERLAAGDRTTRERTG